MTTSKPSQHELQLESLLVDLRSEQTALAEFIGSLERYLSIRGKRSGASSGQSLQQPPLAGLGSEERRNAIKGKISIRKAIAEVLQEANRPMKADEIWRFVENKGARTGSKRPEAIVALTCAGMEHVEKVAPRTFQWKQ